MSFAIAGTVLTVGATAYGANRAGAAADEAARASDAATAEQARQYDQTREDLASGRALYDSSNNALAGLFGFGTAGTPGYFDEAAYLRDNPDVAAGEWSRANPQAHYDRYGRLEGRASPYVGAVAPTPGGAPDMSAFFKSPDYNFRREEGTRGIENSFAARGGALSGNALRALTEFNSGLASTEYGNFFNRLTTMAGLGGAATDSGINAGMNYANNVSQNAMTSGNARASGVVNQANIMGQGVNSLAGMWGYFGGNRNNSGLQPYQITGLASRRM